MTNSNQIQPVGIQVAKVVVIFNTVACVLAMISLHMPHRESISQSWAIFYHLYYAGYLFLGIVSLVGFKKKSLWGWKFALALMGLGAVFAMYKLISTYLVYELSFTIYHSVVILNLVICLSGFALLLNDNSKKYFMKSVR